MAGCRNDVDPDAPSLEEGILWLIEISVSLISTSISAPIFLTITFVSSTVVTGTSLISRQSLRVYWAWSSMAERKSLISFFILAELLLRRPFSWAKVFACSSKPSNLSFHCFQFCIIEVHRFLISLQLCVQDGWQDGRQFGF